MIISDLRKGANNSRILLAFDGMPLETAQERALELSPHSAGGKANNLIDRHGISALSGMNLGIRFYDAKIKDIGATVRNRLLEYRTHADLVTVHADMTSDTLEIAAKTAEVCGFACLAVTLLTDISSEECYEIYGSSPVDMVSKFTVKARRAGIQGIVCSPQETKTVRELFPEGIIVNPGVRLADSDNHDQARVGDPEQAIHDGADMLVVGRDILGEKTASERLHKLLRYNTAVNDALAFA